MATPTVTLTLGDRVVNTTHTFVTKKPADVIFEQNLLLGSLWHADKMPGTPGAKPPGIPVPKGRVKRRNARELWIPIATTKSTTVQPFQNADTLDTNIDDIGTVQRFHYAYYTGYAGITVQEHLENTGPEAMINTLQTRIDQVFRTFSETVETDLWGSGDGSTVDSSEQEKRILGIQHLVATTPTNTVWNIDRSANTYHKNQTINAADTFANVGKAKMRRMRTSVSGTSGVDGPTIIMTTSLLWEAYMVEVEDIYKPTQIRQGDITAEALFYNGIPITYSALCLAGAMYFLNLRYWYLFLQPGATFTPYEIGRPANQAIWKSWRIILSLQWGCERYDRQGVIYGFTDA